MRHIRRLTVVRATDEETQRFNELFWLRLTFALIAVVAKDP